MQYEIQKERYYQFSKAWRSALGGADGLAEGVVSAAFVELDSRGSIDRGAPGYELASEYAAHVSENDRTVWPIEDSYSDDELRAIAVYPFEELSRKYGVSMTCKALNDVALALLDVQPEDSLADLCCGIGSFMSRAAQSTNLASFFGVEINYSVAMVSAIRALILGLDAEIQVSDMFRSDYAFDKVFCNYPLGQKLSRHASESDSYMRGVIPQGIRVHSADWAYNLKIAQSLRTGGKGIGVMPYGGLFNAMDEQIREYMVRSGILEAVVALPEGMLSETNIPCAMTVLSTGNRAVKLVDASDLGEYSKGSRVMSRKDIEEIARRFREGTDRSREISADELQENRWNLMPSRYLGRIEVEGGVAVSELVSGISRGLGKTVKERLSDTETPIKYLMMKDINEGEIAANLPWLTEIEKREEKYLVNEGDVIIGKMKPFKAAVAHVPEGQRLLAAGNLYILRTDTGKVLPEYLRLALESDIGKAQLESKMTGTTITSVPVSAFDEIQIPLIPLEKQRKLIDEYKELSERARMYERKAQSIRDEIAGLVGKGGKSHAKA